MKFDSKTIQMDLKSAQGERETVFRPKNRFQNFSIFGLKKISKIFQNLCKNFEFFKLFFVKSCNFFPVFIVAYHLQLIGVPNGFYRTSLTLLVQEKRCSKNGQKFNFFDKIFSKIFFEWFLWKVTLNTPPLFFDDRHFLSWATKVKSQPFLRKSQKSPKIVKNLEIFQKIDFCHPGSDWLPKREYLCLIFDPYWKKIFFLIKSGIFWPFLSKSQ